MAPPSPLLAVSTVTAHPSTASVPIAVLLYVGPLLGGFNAAIKGLTTSRLPLYFHCASHGIFNVGIFRYIISSCVIKSLLVNVADLRDDNALLFF